MSVADFMKTCLAHPQYGYYMHTEHKVFGSKGDFVTSPEISQLFGELVGVWLVATWQALGMPKKVAFVECGPGKGTLMADVLKVAKKFPAFYDCIQRVDLVETSANLRKVQADTLGLFLLEKETRWYDRVEDIGSQHDVDNDASAVKGSDEGSKGDDVDDVVPLMLAHELFDALPVHQLTWTKEASGPAWRERLVQVDPEADVAVPMEPSAGSSSAGVSISTKSSEDEPFPHFDVVVAPSATPASAAFTALLASSGKQSSATTSLPEGSVVEYSPACVSVVSSISKRLARTGGACLIVDYGYSAKCNNSSSSALPTAPSFATASSFLDALPALPADPRGFRPTVRGIRNHRFVDMLSTPGEADLSADVDFDALARAAVESAGVELKEEPRLSPSSSASASPSSSLDDQIEAMVASARLSSGGRAAAAAAQAVTAKKVLTASPSASLSSPVAIAGPVTQGEFLVRMGIGARLQRLLGQIDAKAAFDAEQVKARLMGEAKRLAGTEDDEDMGGIYKAMALVSPVVGGGKGSNASEDPAVARAREEAAWKLASQVSGF